MVLDILFRFLPDDGAGNKKIWRVENLELKPVDTTVEHLFGGDSYVIQYTTPDINIIYFWQVTNNYNTNYYAMIL